MDETINKGEIDGAGKPWLVWQDLGCDGWTCSGFDTEAAARAYVAWMGHPGRTDLVLTARHEPTA